jgi:hypothetical protein
MPIHDRPYTPLAIENLADLGASYDDLDMIGAAVKELAVNPEAGNPVGFIFWGKKLFQYQVGRYKLNYTFTNGQLSVESVIV